MACLAKAYHNYYYRPQNLQTPISPFTIASPSSQSMASSIIPNLENLNRPQFGSFLIPAVALAASTLFFAKSHQNPPIIAAPIETQLELEKEGSMKELELIHSPSYIKSLHFLKLKEGTVLRMMVDVDESSNYASVKTRIRSSAEWLESARKDLQEIVERDPNRVMEYILVIDELMDLLREMEVYVERCEKKKVKRYLRSWNALLERVLEMEEEIVDALQKFHDKKEKED